MGDRMGDRISGLLYQSVAKEEKITSQKDKREKKKKKKKKEERRNSPSLTFRCRFRA